MSLSTRLTPTAHTAGGPGVADAGRQAFWVLRIGFTALPILFGLDKFANVLTDWTKYLAPQIDRIVPGTAHQAMLAVGVVEIVAGLVVALLPRFGGPLVALWLAGIILNLLLIGGYGDVALRDFGLFVAAVGLTRLAWAVHAERAGTVMTEPAVRS